jgi:hypothetical protein
MGGGVIIAFFLGIFILLLSGVSYFVLKHYGYKKTGIAVSLFFALIVLIPFFATVFESQLYFKSDSKKDLEVAGIVLKDDFEITLSDIFGMEDYYQITKLKISSNDRDRIIQQIITKKNFVVLKENNGAHNLQMYEDSHKIIWYYKANNDYVIETYEKKSGYSPFKLTLTVNKQTNILDLTVIQD